MKIVLLVISLMVMTGCGTTQSLKEANDLTFGAAMIRICDPFAMLAAQRKLTEDGYVALELLCEETKYGYLAP